MDPKKQDLTPELKQIYDRVMNTQVVGKTPAESGPKPTSNVSGQAMPTAPILNTPPSPSVQPAATSPSSPASQQQSPPTPSVQPFLSSVPPRPVSETKPFVFTGKKVENQHAPMGGAQIQVNGGKKLSGKIIAVLVGVLIILWSVFWAKFFGVI